MALGGSNTTQRRRPAALLLGGLLYTGAHLLAAASADAFRVESGWSLWCPPAALALGLFLVAGWVAFPLALCARVVTMALLGDPHLSMLELVLQGALELSIYAAAAEILRRRLDLTVGFRDVRDVAWFAAVAAVVAPALVATVSASLFSGHSWGERPEAVAQLWVGRSAAVMSILPAVLVAIAGRDAWTRRLRQFAGSAVGLELAAGVVALTGLTLLAVELSLFGSSNVLYLAFVPLLVLAFRFGIGGVAPAVLLTTVVVAVVTLARHPDDSVVLEGQLFLSVMSLCGLAVGAVINERTRGREVLREAEERFRSAFDNAAIGMALVGLDPLSPGRFTQVNPQLCMITGYRSAELMSRSLASLDAHGGAWDVLTRFTTGELRTFHDEREWFHANGHQLAVEVNASVVNDHTGRPGYLVLQVEDVTERRAAQDRLAFQALHDPLTGLANRALLMDRLEHAMARARRRGAAVCLLFIDLDGLKVVNDTFGHQTGDSVLVGAGRRLRSDRRASDTVARLGGDEFVVLCEDLPGTGWDLEEQAIAVARRVSAALAGPYVIEGTEVAAAASVGYAVGHGDETPEEILNRADRAMYREKQRRQTGDLVPAGPLGTVNVRAEPLPTY